MYNIQLAKKEDLESFHRIIILRCKWFKDNKINQWKINSYPVRYDESYFEKQMLENKLFIAKKGNDVVGGFLLIDDDPDHWSDCDKVKAYYLHHFASKVGENGIGKIMINFALEEAKKNNKEYLRLDCVSDNEKLNNYYKSLGFECVGHIKMKSWSENLWQIKL